MNTETLITEIETLVKENPNNYDLGSAIRKLIRESREELEKLIDDGE